MPAIPARRNKEIHVNVYFITHNGKTVSVTASSARAAMMKHFGVPTVEGATIKLGGKQ